jgi:hypothetical protein
MKRRLLGMLSLGILSLASTSAFAGDILLNQNNGYLTTAGIAVNFTGTDGGSAFNVAFTSMAYGAAHTFGLGSTDKSGFYTVQQNGATVNYMGTSCGAQCYSLNQTGNLLFDYGSAKNSGNFLTGFLQLVNVTQTGTVGNFNDMMTVNLVVNGGSLASKFPGNNAVVQLTLAFKSATSLTSLLTGQKLGAWINSGTVNPTGTVPEPASVLMLGASLAGFVALLRRKNLSAV